MAESTIYDYLHPADGNLIRQWTERLQVKERAKLNSKIDALAMHGADLIPGIVTPTGVPAIFKLRVQGRVKLRPLLCEGPGGGNGGVFTFLLGAFEISWDYDPPNAPTIAAGHRRDLIANPLQRRIHERVS